ncbi:MAG TPA: heme-copper oxidase subunit III [Puia sp.]|nr:heme-copper oxidase subunit III [Puia sp.]
MTQSENTTMMQLVIYTEAFFFLCLIMAFVYMAYNSGFEPHELDRLDIRTAGIFTAVLIASSITLHFAERGYTRGKPAALKGWLIVTIVLGAIFLAGQGNEYVRLIRDDITLNGSVFGASFFTLTGFHGLHVLVGLVILSIVLVLAFLRDSKSAIGTVALYWHFVDVVWLFVFTVVYVLPQFTTI